MSRVYKAMNNYYSEKKKVNIFFIILVSQTGVGRLLLKTFEKKVNLIGLS